MRPHMDDEQTPAGGVPGPQTQAGDEWVVVASPPPLIGSGHEAVGESSACGPQLGDARSTPTAEFSSLISSPPSSSLTSLAETPSPPSSTEVQGKGKGRASTTTTQELSSLSTTPLPQSSLHPTSSLPTARLPRSSPHQSSASSSTTESGLPSVTQAPKPRGRGRKGKGKARARKGGSCTDVIPGRKDLGTRPCPSDSQFRIEPRKRKRKGATAKEPPLDSNTPLAGPSPAVYDMDAMGPRWGRWIAPLPLRKGVAPRVPDAEDVAAVKAQKEREDTRDLAGGSFAPASSQVTEAAPQLQSAATGRVPTINDLMGPDFVQPYWSPKSLEEVSAEWGAEQDAWYERIKVTRRVPTINDLMRPDFVQPYRPLMTWGEASVEWRAQEAARRATETAATTATTEDAETPVVAEDPNPVPSSAASSSMDKTRAATNHMMDGSGGSCKALAGDVSRNPRELSAAVVSPVSDATVTTPAKRSWEIVDLTVDSDREAFQPHKRYRPSPKGPAASSYHPGVGPNNQLPHGGRNVSSEFVSQPETRTESKTDNEP